jgi:tetratricopeptide (TPR) repeat protein
MNKECLYIFVFLVISYSCGTSRSISEGKQIIGAEEHPYITKFHEGIRLKVKGRYNEAIAIFEECLLMRQDDDAVYYVLSKLELSKGNLEKSSEYILNAANLDPDNKWYVQELAYMYYEQEKFDKAVAKFKLLVAIEPRNIDWQYGYAEALFRIGKTERGIDALNKTEDQLGISPSLSVQKYNWFMSINKPNEALEEIIAAQKIFPKDPQLIATFVEHYFAIDQIDMAVEMLEKLVIADPNNGRAHLALADVLQQKGEKKRAYKELKLAFNAPDIDLDTKMQILSTILESTYKIDPELFDIVEGLVVSHPNEGKSHAILGDYLYRLEKEEEALKSYQKALEFDKSEYPIWNQVLLMEYQSGNYNDLYVDSKECLTLFPAVSIIYLLNGVGANQLNNHEEALEVLFLGRELVLNDRPLEAEFYAQIGDSYFGLSELNEAKANYRTAMELDKQSSLILNNFAYRLSMAKVDLDLAESLAKRAVEMAPEQSTFLDTYGWVFFQKGNYNQALVQFERAYNLNKEDNMNVEHMGDVYFKKGNIEQAVMWWKKAKKLSSSNKNLDKKIQEKKYYEPDY